MNRERFERAVSAFDRANCEDPRTLLSDGQLRPRELVNAERLSAWVVQLAPNASETLQLAARCQHICRWQMPRSAYPAGRVGYLQWRTQLARFHADTAARLLAECGYEQDTIDAVRRINLKQNMRSSPDMAIMEDALCLSFLQFEFDEFIAKYQPEKAVEVVQKTWKKMSERGHQFALALPFSATARELVMRALAP